jgi:hypothetical protein
MGNKRITDFVTEVTASELTSADMVVVSRPADDVKVSATSMIGGGDGGGSATDIGGIEVAITSPSNRQVLRLNTDLNPDKWVNATIAADTVTLQVSDAVGTATPPDPLAGGAASATNAFKTLAQAIAWARANLRITTSLTLNVAQGQYNESNVNGISIGGDGYFVDVVGAGSGTTFLNDTSGVTSTASKATQAGLQLNGRVRLQGLTIRAQGSTIRWAVHCNYSCSAEFDNCVLNTVTTSTWQAIQTRDMQVRFTGSCIINGQTSFDNALVVSMNSTLTVNSPNTAAMWFRGNADLVFGSSARISLGTAPGNSKVVQVSNSSGVNTNPNNWGTGTEAPVFSYTTPQPVRSDVTGINGSTAVRNMVFVGQLPGTTDPNTFYLIP